MTHYNWNSLDALLRPKSVALIGASPDESKYPGKVIRNLQRSGFSGKVYPINPKYPEIFGFKAYGSLGELPEPADVALLLVGARNIPALLDELIAAGTRTAIVYASGMAEASEAGAALQDEIARKAATGGIRLLGPNCLGCIDRDHGTWLSGAAVLGRETLLPGPLAMVTQSGGIMGSFLDRAMAHGIGFSKAIATGNEADINVADCIGYFAQDDRTLAIAVFAESIRDIPKFRAACELAAANEKPIVLMKTGRSERGKRVTQGHTAAQIGDDAAYDALFRELGIIRVESLDDLFLIPNAIVNMPRPAGERVAIISASGGLAGLSADLCERENVTMAEFSDATQQEVNSLQAGYGGCYNPLDITGQVVSKDSWWQVRHMHDLLLKDSNVDLVISGQAAGQFADQTGRDLVEMAQAAAKPLLPFWTGRELNADGLRRLRDADLPVFEQAEACIRAAKASISYAAFLRRCGTAGSAPARDTKRGEALTVAVKQGRAAQTLGELYGLPQPTASLDPENTIVRLKVRVDDQVGQFMTVRGDARPLNLPLPTDIDAARREMADALPGNPAAQDTLAKILVALAAAGRDGGIAIACTLAVAPDGAVCGAAYSVGS